MIFLRATLVTPTEYWKMLLAFISGKGRRRRGEVTFRVALRRMRKVASVSVTRTRCWNLCNSFKPFLFGGREALVYISRDSRYVQRFCVRTCVRSRALLPILTRI